MPVATGQSSPEPRAEPPSTAPHRRTERREIAIPASELPQHLPPSGGRADEPLRLSDGRSLKPDEALLVERLSKQLAESVSLTELSGAEAASLEGYYRHLDAIYRRSKYDNVVEAVRLGFARVIPGLPSGVGDFVFFGSIEQVDDEEYGCLVYFPEVEFPGIVQMRQASLEARAAWLGEVAENFNTQQPVWRAEVYRAVRAGDNLSAAGPVHEAIRLGLLVFIDDVQHFVGPAN